MGVAPSKAPADLNAILGGVETDKKKHCEQTEEWLRMLIDTAEDYAIFAINSQGRIATWSRGAEKIFGYSAAEILQQEFAIIFTPEDRATGVPQKEIDHAQREGFCPDVRWHLRKDGRRIFVSGAVRPLRALKGAPHGFIKVAHDITEQRRIELQLKESQERLRLLIENVKDVALFTLDVSGNITHWNPGAQRLLGYSEEEIVGQSVDCLYSKEDRKAGTPARERDIALRDGVRVSETWFVRKDGTHLLVSEALRRMEDNQGSVRGFVKVAHDITERKKLEDDLRQARDHLETLVAERTTRLRETIGELEAFSYSVSHDLRAPLRTMQGFSEILKAEHGAKLGPQAIGLLDRIIEGAKRSDDLIRDVLTLSRVAREETELNSVDLAKVLHHVISGNPEFQPPSAEISIAPLHHVMGHAARLSQCFTNLLGNAVKFVAPGVRPQIKIWSESLDGHIRIWIEDNGIGIPKGQEERIFNLFQRLHREDAYHGTGVGLAIVRKAVERMNGKTGVQSEPGKGSRFWIELAAAHD